jgi:DNA-nicking Smr family endonuclease
MAKTNDFSELAKLVKRERQALRKAQRDALLVPAANVGHCVEESVRFADLFQPMREFAPPSDAERMLFRTAVADATPLVDTTRVAHAIARPSAIPRKTQADEKAALLASQLAMNPSPMSWDVGVDIEDEQSYLRAGVNPDLLRKLRRGQWTIQGELDLHRHTQEEAHAAIAEFVRSARDKEWRCVRIIHGKGLSSHMKIPVLRSKVRRWLQQKDEVLAYYEPRPNGGGSGAVLVLLRGAK